jgi:GNAT superfamily N-acetyltransferase
MFHIVQASIADTNDLIRLFGELHQYNAMLDPRFELANNWQELVREYLQQSSEADDSAWLIARVGERTVGFVLVEVHADSPLYRHRYWAEIVGLYVEPEYRGTAIAEALMQSSYDWAKQRKLRVMQLYVTATNERAQQFYAREGFVVTQYIMRRMAPEGVDMGIASSCHHASHLHFSESGARPLDMHERDHQHEPDNDVLHD